MEIVGIVDILDLCWINFFLESSKIIFIEFTCIFSCEGFLNWMMESLLILTIYCFTSCSSKALTEEILTGNLWNITLIAWNMLGLDISIWSTDPIFTFH
jgi:hypothetical protein